MAQAPAGAPPAPAWPRSAATRAAGLGLFVGCGCAALGALVAAALILALIAANGGLRAPQLGDNSHTVTFKNSTGVPLTLYECDRAYPACERSLDAGGFLSSALVIPFPDQAERIQGSRRIEADDAAGNRVFCRLYTYEELGRLNWTIDVARDLRC